MYKLLYHIACQQNGNLKITKAAKTSNVIRLYQVQVE